MHFLFAPNWAILFLIHCLASERIVMGKGKDPDKGKNKDSKPGVEKDKKKDKKKKKK